MKKINQLLTYALENDIIKERDVLYYANILSNTFKLDKVIFSKALYEGHIDELLEELAKEYFENDNSDILECNKSYIINQLMPPPSYFTNFELKEFFEYMKKANYIKTKNLNKNVEFSGNSKYGKILISINLSKPEKDPLEIEKLKKQIFNNDYPKCNLCVENEGYFGRAGYADRSNHRMIEYKKDSFIQFSPYQYYNEHAIVLSKKHEDMKIDKTTFIELLDFVDIYPRYFIGSNADLPIVGGSILNHAHYQCGDFDFPIFDANVHYSKNNNGLKIEILEWPLNVIRLKSSNKELLIDKCDELLIKWRSYNNTELNIHSFTTEQHNTITPIVRKVGEQYEMYIVLRNNIKTKEQPFGLYHPHLDKHFLKKENIGLIEVMGLAILPPRILMDMQNVQNGIEVENYPKNYDLHDFIVKTFVSVLEDCGVFKDLEQIKEILSI